MCSLEHLIWQRLTQLYSSRSNDSKMRPGEPAACCSQRPMCRPQKTRWSLKRSKKCATLSRHWSRRSGRFSGWRDSFAWRLMIGVAAAEKKEPARGAFDPSRQWTAWPKRNFSRVRESAPANANSRPICKPEPHWREGRLGGVRRIRLLLWPKAGVTLKDPVVKVVFLVASLLLRAKWPDPQKLDIAKVEFCGNNLIFAFLAPYSWSLPSFSTQVVTHTQILRHPQRTSWNARTQPNHLIGGAALTKLDLTVLKFLFSADPNQAH